MEFDVRCRLCGDVEAFGPTLCPSCRKPLYIGLGVGFLVASACFAYLPTVIELAVLALLSR